MADEKKKSVKKTEVKKTTKNKEPDLTINVDKGGQTICTFLLTPSLPRKGKATDWQVVKADGSTKDLDSIKVSFSPDSTQTERYFERAVLIVKMLQNPEDDGVWRFSSDGVVVNSATPDSNHDIAVEVVDQGMTLIAYIHDIDSATEEVRYSYLASFTDKKSGQVTVYQSQDPGVGVGRP